MQDLFKQVLRHFIDRLANVGNGWTVGNIHSARVALSRHDVPHQQTHLLRVCLLGIRCEVEPEQVVVQVLRGNAVKLPHKAFQPAVIGIDVLDAVTALLGRISVHHHAIESMLRGEAIVHRCPIRTHRGSLCDMPTQHRLQPRIRTLASLRNLGNALPAAVHGTRHTDLLKRKPTLSPPVEDR